MTRQIQLVLALVMCGAASVAVAQTSRQLQTIINGRPLTAQQIAAFHQQQPQVAGEVGVAEEIVVARPRRQQRDGWIDAVGATRQRRPQLLEERRQPGAQAVADRHIHAVGHKIGEAPRGGDVQVDVRVLPAEAAQERHQP